MPDVDGVVAWFRALVGTAQTDGQCRCETNFDEDVLTVDARDCPGDGDLEGAPACRATVVRELEERDVGTVRVRTAGSERTYEDGAELFVAAGRFAAGARYHDERVARKAQRDPLGAATEAAGRVGPVATVGTETGLTAFADNDGYADLLDPVVGPTVSRWRVRRTLPDGATIDATRDLSTGATVRLYDHPDSGVRRYLLHPREAEFDERALAVLDEAHEHLATATGTVVSDRGPRRAVRQCATADAPTEALGSVLWKHTRGFGLLEDLFADPRVSDVFVTAPAPANPLRVTVDGETLDTNVRLTEAGVRALASRFRRESGRAFSRASPTLDAATEIADRRVRVAGVTEPASDGHAFAFRAHDRQTWKLPDLVENGTLTPRAAALLSLAVERGRAVLLAGARGTGKTTMLGALLWELPDPVRTVVIEDAPELPVNAIQAAGRDVQGLRATDAGEELPPAAALRSALRLGDGALVVGEVRGEEASVLYEAMRVGANSEAVLGTIHGSGGESVYERVVSDLGVSPEAFGVTDLVVTLETVETARGTARRVRTIEEVRSGAEPGFEPLLDRADAALEPTGALERGNSHLVAALAEPDETYSDVLDGLDDRTDRFEVSRPARQETGSERRTEGRP